MGRTIDPGEVHFVELRLREAAPLDHFLHRHAKLAFLAALSSRLELLDLGKEAFQGRFQLLWTRLKLGRAEPARQHLTDPRPLRWAKR